MATGNTTAIIQARLTSSRLPGKVLLDIAGEPMLVRVVERTLRASTLNHVVIATTTDPSDDVIEALCIERGYAYYRGSQHDVLDRYYQAARTFGAEAIVRITADCPLIDPDVIDKTVNAFYGEPSHNHQSPLSPTPLSPTPLSPPAYDFAANRLPPPWGRTYPIGLDTEVCTFQALERAWREADQPYQREHVMPYIYEPVRAQHFSSPEQVQPEQVDPSKDFRVLLVNHDPDYGRLRWTVDTPEDLDLIRQIFALLGGRDDFTWLDVLALFKREPRLAQINAQVRHKDYQAVDTRRNSSA